MNIYQNVYKCYKRSNIFTLLSKNVHNSHLGVLYDNICMLQQAACLANQDIQRAPLNTCGGKIRLIMMVAMMIMMEAYSHHVGFSSAMMMVGIPQ